MQQIEWLITSTPSAHINIDPSNLTDQQLALLWAAKISPDEETQQLLLRELVRLIYSPGADSDLARQASQSLCRVHGKLEKLSL